MPRAQVLLLGAVVASFICTLAAASFDVHQTTDVAAGDLRLLADFDPPDFSDEDEWTQEELELLKQMMDEHVSQFKAELDKFDDFASRSRRSKRETFIRSLTVTGTNRIPSISLNSSASHQLASQGSINCFLWNDKRYCILGGTIFAFNGKVEPFLSGLPIGPNDHVKSYVFDDVIFLAIYNKVTATLRLCLLRSPGWKTLISVQQITAQVLEDCVFFEYEGTLYMALAIQLGDKQFAENVGMQCVIYEWLGTTMDKKHSFAAPGLRMMNVLQSTDTVHLVLIQGDSNIHLRRFTDSEETELEEIIDVHLDRINQFDTFVMDSQWCLFLGGPNKSYIYCLREQRLLQRQILLHNHTSSSVSWTRVQQDGIRDGYESIILIFNAFDSESIFEFYVSDPSGEFNLIFTTPQLKLDGFAVASLALLDGHNSAHLYMATTEENRFFLEGFAIQLVEEFHEEMQTDPVIQCLSDIDFLISKLDTATIEHVEKLKNNMVHNTDNFATNGTIVTNQLSYSGQPVIGTVKVLYNFSEEFKRPKEIESTLNDLELAAKNLSLDLPNLLSTTNSNSTFKGRLIVDGTVTADQVSVPAASVNKVNDRDWDEFTQQAWRYSSERTIEHDIKIDRVKAENVSVGSTIASSRPSRWLLKTGGELTGKTNFFSLDVGGSIDVDKINDVAMEDVLEKKNEPYVIRGWKTFKAVEVKTNVTAERINERDDFEKWAEKLVLQKSEEKQHFTGLVRLQGPVHVVEHFRSDWINGINVSSLPEILVDKNSHQIVTGAVRFTGPLLVVDAQVDYLNGLLIEDLLSTSGQQTIRASIDVDVLEVKGDLECHDINGENVDDFVYTDEDDLQVIVGRVRFEKDLVVKHLRMDNGTLNGVDVISLLNPPSLRIDSQIHANGDLSAHAAHVKVINGIELSEIRSQYWTKSTKQSIDVNVRMPFEVIVKENMTTKTFMNHSLERDFYRTKANETFVDDVMFTDDVIMQSDLMIQNLNDINGVTLQALDEDVVKKEGDFTILGTKTFEELIIRGNLAVETFNSLNIPQDIAVLNRTQTLTGLQFASDAIANGDVISSRGDITLNMVAGILLDDFVSNAAMIDEDADFDGSIHFKRHLDVADLVIENSLNGHDVNNIVRNGLRKTNQDILELSKLTVHGNVTFKNSVDVNLINSYDVEEYLSQVVNMTNPGVVTGRKKTLHPTIVSQDAIFESFNDIRLDFATLLTASGNQTISGEFILDHLISEEMELRAINGQDLSDFVKTAGTKDVQVIKGPVDIEQMTVEGALKIENHVLNGCNLTDYLDVTKFTHFDSLSIRNGTLLLDQPLDNNPDLAAIVLKALRKDRPETVTGNVSFVSDVVIANLNISQNRVGSVDLKELLHGSMLKSVEQNVSGTIKYVNGLEVDRVEHAGHLNVSTWNGKDVQYMVDQVVLKTGNQTVSAKKTFTSDLNIRGNLQVKGNIDDVPIKSLVKTSDPQLPSGTNFTSLVVKKHLNVTSGIIDGVNITSVLQQRVPLKGNCTLKSNITFKNPVTADNVSVKQINNLNMTDLVLKTAAPSQVISGKKHLTGNLDVEGDVTVKLLNGRNPEEMAAFIVLKDQDAEFQKSVVFLGGLTVVKDVNITNYNGADLNQLIATNTEVPVESRAHLSRTPALPLLLSLQNSKGKLANFEFFEQIQQIPFNFPHGANTSIQIQHCPIQTRKQSSSSDTAAGILVATHSTDGNSCKLKKICRCHRSVTLPSDTNGLLNTLRVPIRLKDYMEDNLIYGDRVRLLHSEEHLFIFTMESLPGCLTEKVSIAVFNPVTFKMVTEVAFELNDTVVDVALEERNAQVILAISQKMAGIWIYSFDGALFHFEQLIDTDIVASIHMTSHKDAVFLAVASYGLEAMSSIWNLSSSRSQFELMKDVITVGATDVIFTKSSDDVYLTFAQDPSSIDAYTDNWSQFKVPAQVLMYIPSFRTFEVVQQLDVDRVVSLANLVITGDPFLAVATFTGKVKIYRLIKGQGFQAEQMFKNPGVRSIAGYSIRNETYLTTATESRLTVFVARLRGLQKPSIKL